MTNLHIIVLDADDTTRRRATNALTQAGIKPDDAWLDPRTLADVHTAQDQPVDADAQARAFEAGARRGLEIALDEVNRPGVTLDNLRRVLPQVAADPSEYVGEHGQPWHVRRDWGGVALGAVFAVGGGAGAWLLWGLGGWWIAGAVVCALAALFGVVGFCADLQKKPREERTGA